MIDYSSLKQITMDEEKEAVKRLIQERNENSYCGKYYIGEWWDGSLGCLCAVVYKMSETEQACMNIADMCTTLSKYEEYVTDVLDEFPRWIKETKWVEKYTTGSQKYIGEYKARNINAGNLVTGHYEKISCKNGNTLHMIENGMYGNRHRRWAIDPNTLERKQHGEAV